MRASGCGWTTRPASASSRAASAPTSAPHSTAAAASGAERRDALGAAYRNSPGESWIEVRESIVDALEAAGGADQLLQEMRGDAAPTVRAKASAALGVAPEAAAPEISPSPYLETVFDEDPRVVLETDRGRIVIRCYTDEAPLHVAAFLDLVDRGFYDGLTWHRVVQNFVIQGGDPRGDGWGGAGFLLRDEIGRRRFERGTVGMPKAGKDTGGGQLFVTHVPTPHLDGRYTVYASVEDGVCQPPRCASRVVDVE